MNFYELTTLSLAVAAASMTITKSNAMIWFRELVSKLGYWAEELIHCPYCLSHSLAALSIVMWYRGSPKEMILTWLAVVALASLASLGITLFFLALDILERLEE
jgi:hypothetical protein